MSPTSSRLWSSLNISIRPVFPNSFNASTASEKGEALPTTPEPLRQFVTKTSNASQWHLPKHKATSFYCCKRNPSVQILGSAIIKYFNNSLNQSDFPNNPKVADSLLFQALFPWDQVLPLKITQWFQSRVPKLFHAVFTQTLVSSFGHLSHGQWSKTVSKQKLNLLLFILTYLFV